MDRRIFEWASGFLFGTVFIGILINEISASSGGNMLRVLFQCPADDLVCQSTGNLLWSMILAASLLSLISLFVNIVWWKSRLKKISVDVPIDEISNDAIITINNDNNDDLTDLHIYLLKHKSPTFISSLNTLFEDKFKTVSFRLDNQSVGAKRKVSEKLAEVYKDDRIEYPITKFLIGENKKWLYGNHNYVPFSVTNENSSDSEKGKPDIYASLYDLVFEVRGNIGSGRISKIYRGRLLQMLLVEKWEKVKYRNKYRWKERKSPSLKADIRWLDFYEYSMKELKKDNKEDKDRGIKSSTAEIFNEETLRKALVNIKKSRKK